MVRKKLGNISISVLTIFAMIVIVIIFVFSISYVQITSTILNIKNDLYNIAQNGIVANNKTELALNNYIVENTQMKNYIQDILEKSYIRSNGYITSVQVVECNIIQNKSEIISHTKGRYDKTIIHLTIKMDFIPIIKIRGFREEVSIYIHEDVKAVLLQYGGR